MTSSCIDDVAAELGLEVVSHFADGVFGAALVRRDSGELAVLKAQPQPDLRLVWTTGAAMAELLRTRGYPAPKYAEVGATAAAVWSVQEHLAGDVADHLTVAHASQLVALARTHNVDSGLRRNWRHDAIAAARGWLSAVSIDAEDARALAAALDRGVDAELLETTVVHGDFHHRNSFVLNGRVVGVFDWEIAGPGDWRFDLVMLAFACLTQPRMCDPDAIRVVEDAVRRECPAGVSELMMACQVLRILAMTAVRAPDRVPTFSRRMLQTLGGWLPG